MIGFDVGGWSFGAEVSDEGIALYFYVLFGFDCLLGLLFLFLEIISMRRDLSLGWNFYHVCFLCFLLGFEEIGVGCSWTTLYGLDFF
jgi:hypothetical protein